MMDFSVDLFKRNGIRFPMAFEMKDSLDFHKLYQLEQAFFEKGVKIETALKRLKERMSKNYYYHVLTAQTEAQNYSINIFPSYKLLLPDVLMDDWLSIMGPHQNNRRDHSLHQPLTAYIVSELLGGGVKGKGLEIEPKKTLLDECTRIFLEGQGTEYLRLYYRDLNKKGMPPEGFIRMTWGRSLFYHTAIIAALFHDIGYPWQFLNKVASHMDMVDFECVGPSNNTCKGILDYFKNSLLIYPFYGYSDIPLKRPTLHWDKEVQKLVDCAYRNTHGFPGALAFMYLNDVIRKFPNKTNHMHADCRFIQNWATLGIMMHDMVDQYYGKNKNPDEPRYKLEIDKDPLSCIIALADVLEEFGRPKAKFKASDKKVDINFEYPCDQTTVEIKNKTLEITYLYNTKADKANNEKWREDEINKYFHKPSGYIDLSAIGIERATCRVISK